MAWIDTNYGAGQILTALRNDSVTFPSSSWYAGLFLVTPAIDGTGGTEIASSPTHTWYARQLLAWAAPSGRTMSNSGALTFHASSPTAPGTVLSLGIFDAVTSGNLWHILTLTSPLAIGVGSQVIFPIGQIIQEFSAT